MLCAFYTPGLFAMAKKYQNPPIIEAVCEFRLAAESKWDMTIPGIIYERVQKDFPKKQQRVLQEIELTATEKGMRQQVSRKDHVLFLTNDEKTFIQVGPQLLAINRLKPYTSWESFKPEIEKAFTALRKTMDVQGLERIGLRYINRIEVPTRPVDLDEYFEFRPFISPRLPQDMGNFIIGCDFHFFDDRDQCRVQLTPAAPESEDGSAFLLDLDYFLARPKEVIPDQAIVWVEKAHEQVESLFEGCISDTLRKLFVRVG